MVTYGGNRPTVNDDEVLTAQDFNDATRFWVTDELPDAGKDGDVVFVVGDEPSGGGINVESQRKHQLLQGNDSKGWVPGMAMSVVDALPADDAEGYAIGDVVFVTGPGDGGASSSHSHDQGFNKVVSQNFTSEASSWAFDDLFDPSGNPSVYLVVINSQGTNANTTHFRFRLRQNGSSVSSANSYQYYGVVQNNTTGPIRDYGLGDFGVLGNIGTLCGNVVAWIICPSSNNYPTIATQMLGSGGSNAYTGTFQTRVVNPGNYDGIEFYPNDGTLKGGTVRIYELKGSS